MSGRRVLEAYGTGFAAVLRTANPPPPPPTVAELRELYVDGAIDVEELELELERALPLERP